MFFFTIQNSEITPGLATTPKQTLIFSPPFKTDHQKSDQHRPAKQIIEPRADVVSPVLFDEQSKGGIKDKLDVGEIRNNISITAGSMVEVNEPIQKKKPIFKKKAVKSEKQEPTTKTTRC